MEAGKTVVPMRALTYIKSAFPGQIFKTSFAYLFHAFWTLHRVPNSVAVLEAILCEIPAGFILGSKSTPPSSEPKLLTREQVRQILAGASAADTKNALKARVDEALARGAFGAPWIWATDEKGTSEPFFGSDRWHCVYDFLDVPYQKIELLPPKQQKASL
ncbi:hypothetical protein F4777DRAFT_530622 [Nemania sp. FL0916]|nr:hypothetical protein F4777DRAFT_530622 [Nemania sp. FL0916]